jgi:hypothetical protein
LSSRERAQAAIYAGLFVLVLLSGTLFLSQYAGSAAFWKHFTVA